MSTYTEDHLVEQPAVQLMQDELGWKVGGNIDPSSPVGYAETRHRTLNIEHRSEEKRKTWANPAFQRLNPELTHSGFPRAGRLRSFLDTLYSHAF